MELADHSYILFVEAKMEILRTRRDFVKGIAIGILGATAQGKRVKRGQFALPAKNHSIVPMTCSGFLQNER